MLQNKRLFDSVLVIGASRKTGSLVSKKLTSIGIPHKTAARTSGLRFDWNDENTWKDALNGTTAIYLTYFPNLTVPSAIEHICRFCSLAKELNVKHITMLSERGEDVALLCERIVINSSLSWTIVRTSLLYQNFTEGLFNYYIKNGLIALPVTSIKEPFVDIHDIADAVVASLTDVRHENKIYEVTGPELLSFLDIARKFSEVLGRKIEFKPTSLEEFFMKLFRLGLAPEIIQKYKYLSTVMLDGKNEYLSSGLQLAINRAPITFDEFILQNRDCFIDS